MESAEFTQFMAFCLACNSRDVLRAVDANHFSDAGVARVIDEMQKVDSGLVTPDEALRLSEFLARYGIVLNGRKVWQAVVEKLEADGKREKARRIVAGLHTAGKTLSNADYIQKLKDLVDGL